MGAGLQEIEALIDQEPARAVDLARTVLAARPDSAAVYGLLGRALARCGRSGEAMAVLQDPAAAGHGSAEAWRVLGDLLLVSGEAAAADAAYAQQIRASVDDPVLREAALALVDQDLPLAEGLLRARLKAQPTDVAAIRMMAELAARIGRYPDAIKLLGRALELAPSFLPARYNLALVLFRNNQTPDALDELERLLAQDGRNPAYHNLTAVAALRIGQFERALAHFRTVLDLAPDHAKTWMSYGHALKTVGRPDEGVAAYRRAVSLEPLLGEAWWSLANLKTVSFEPADIAAMERALEDPALDEEGRFHLGFALGKAHEDAARFELSFGFYREANRLRRAMLDYQADETSRLADRVCAVFTPELFQARAGCGHDAADPIFVVGMPRSGSTLIEQILASHPAVEGTQELPDIHAMALRLGGGRIEDYPARLAGLPPYALADLGAEYLERTRVQRREGRPLFVDKMPNNWQHVGFIRLILPKATIVDARRHPLACCFSNFKQHFARGQEFAYDLEDLGRYYRDYVRLTAHFDAVLPGHVHRVLHEDMVADPEAEVRRLLAHVGLPFDPACLHFYRNERAVRTASSEQVRRPIFKDGLDQWRHFEPWLDPLRRALGDVAESYPKVPAAVA